MGTKKTIKTPRSAGVATPAERGAADGVSPSSAIRPFTPSVRTKSEALLKEIRRNTRKIYSAEQKIIIVMEGIRGEVSIAELCRRYGISETTYYAWNKEFIEAGKRRLSGDEARQATTSEVTELRKENHKLKEALADMVIRFDIVKKIQEIRDRHSTEEDI